MNIFFLDEDPLKCGPLHPDKLVVKMPLEATQMLSTALIVNGGEGAPKLGSSNGNYRKTHENHPSSIWVRESVSNYLWTVQYLESLIDRYEFVYGKSSSFRPLIRYFLRNSHLIPDGVLADPLIAINLEARERIAHHTGLDQIRDVTARRFPWDLSVFVYQCYISLCKRHYAKWRSGDQPEYYDLIYLTSELCISE